MRAIFFTVASVKCGSCKKGAIPSELPPPAFRALRGTAYICGHPNILIAINGDEPAYELEANAVIQAKRHIGACEIIN